MPRTSPEPERARAGGHVVALGSYGAATDMTVLEFCAGMALARRGALSAREIAAEVSSWLGEPIRARALRLPLCSLVTRGWAELDAGTYSLLEVGTAALRGFYCALVRMLDGGRRLLDVAVFMSLIKEFERSGS